MTIDKRRALFAFILVLVIPAPYYGGGWCWCDWQLTPGLFSLLFGIKALPLLLLYTGIIYILSTGISKISKVSRRDVASNSIPWQLKLAIALAMPWVLYFFGILH